MKATAACGHVDRYGPTVLDGHCFLCNATTPQRSGVRWVLLRSTVFLTVFGIGGLIGQPFLGAACAVGMLTADIIR